MVGQFFIIFAFGLNYVLQSLRRINYCLLQGYIVLPGCLGRLGAVINTAKGVLIAGEIALSWRSLVDDICPLRVCLAQYVSDDLGRAIATRCDVALAVRLFGVRCGPYGNAADVTDVYAPRNRTLESALLDRFARVDLPDGLVGLADLIRSGRSDKGRPVNESWETSQRSCIGERRLAALLHRVDRRDREFRLILVSELPECLLGCGLARGVDNRRRSAFALGGNHGFGLSVPVLLRECVIALLHGLDRGDGGHEDE